MSKSTSFAWKHKAADKIIQQKPTLFDVEEDEDEEIEKHNIKRRKIDDCDPLLVAGRLKEEGIKLAENDRFCEAIDKWQCAVKLNPNDATLFEMISQVQQQKGDIYGAVISAEQSVRLDPVWATARQTLGRAQLSMGEVRMALLNFSRAIHLDPSADDVRNDDIPWALSLDRQSLITNLSAFPVSEETEKLETTKAFIRRRGY